MRIYMHIYMSLSLRAHVSKSGGASGSMSKSRDEGLVFEMALPPLAGGCVYRSSGDGDDYADILVRRGREK